MSGSDDPDIVLDDPDIALGDPGIVPDDKDWTWVLERACPDCGFRAAEHPLEQLGAELRGLAATWRRLLSSEQVSRRPSPQQWSALEYACHVRDVFVLYLARLEQMLTNDDARFANWDQDAAALAGDYGAQDPATVAYDLAAAAGRLADAFDKVRPEQRSRTGLRSDGAHFTVETFGTYLLHDPVHHVWDVERGNEVLAEGH